MKVKKILLVLLPILVLVLIYLGGVIYFNDLFLPNTYLNDENIGGKKVVEVENKLQSDSIKNNIILTKNDGTTEEIALSDFEYTSEYETSIQELKDSQSPFKWPFAYLKEEDYTIPIKTSYNEELLNSLIDKLKCITNEAIQDPVNAHIEKTESGYIVVDAIDGNRLDINKVKSIIKENLDKGQLEIDLAENNCYLTAEIRADDPSITSVMDLVGKFNDLQITIDLVDATETIGFETLDEWITIEDGQVSVDEDAVYTYCANLSIQYNTFETVRKFQATDIGEIEVGAGGNDTFGFQLNVSGTRDLIVEAINNQESTTIEALWNIPAKCRGYNDIGDTYIEVDITRQHWWYYIDGELYLESDCVTGLDTDERRTPEGVFRIWHKEKNKTLNGPGYSTPVAFWMPFSWTGCGFHDATWRSTFGGTYYKTSGSHGCVNTPYENAEKLYEKVAIDTPVIIYSS